MATARQKMPMSPKSKPSARMLVAFQFVFLGMFLMFGLGLVRDGHRAIRDQTYTLRYTEQTSWACGPAWGGSRVSEGVVEYRGSAATILGVGFVSTGTMLLVWATGLGLSLLGRVALKVPPGILRLLGGLALVSLLIGCFALFPPWRIHTLPLYLVVAVFTLAVTLPIPDDLRKKVFPAVVILVILVGMTGFPAFPILAGILIFIMVGTNLLLLWPGLANRITKSQSENCHRA